MKRLLTIEVGLTVAAILFAASILLATSMMVSNAKEERRLNDEALTGANLQMSELRSACTSRVNKLTEDLTKERDEGDTAQVRASRLEQQLLDAGLKPTG